jgi:2-oxoglutarate ferredoxin oxidoreductase subunit alpha
MNPQTWTQDVKEVDPGGYLFYDNTKALPQSKFRDDIHVIGMPLTEICNQNYTDARERQLFKNIIYVGALAGMLGIEPEVIAELIGEQYKGKEKLQRPRQHLHRRQRRDRARLRLRRRHRVRLVPDHALVFASGGLHSPLP